jgi:hypothetical protein
LFAAVLHQLEPNFSCESLESMEDVEVARQLIGGAESIGAIVFCTPNELLTGRPKLQVAFAAQLFNARHGLPPLPDSLLLEAAQVIRMRSSSKDSRGYESPPSRRSGGVPNNSSEIDAIFASRQAVVHVSRDSHSVADSDDETDCSMNSNINQFSHDKWGTPVVPVKTPNKYLSNDYCFLHNGQDSMGSSSSPFRTDDTNESQLILSSDKSTEELEESKDDAAKINVPHLSELRVDVDSDDESTLSRDWRNAVGSPMDINEYESETEDDSLPFGGTPGSGNEELSFWWRLPFLSGNSKSKSFLSQTLSALTAMLGMLYSKRTVILDQVTSSIWWLFCSYIYLWLLVVRSIFGALSGVVSKMLQVPGLILAGVKRAIFRVLSLTVQLFFNAEIVVKPKSS